MSFNNPVILDISIEKEKKKVKTLKESQELSSQNAYKEESVNAGQASKREKANNSQTGGKNRKNK